jgi:hypothetical protein
MSTISYFAKAIEKIDNGPNVLNSIRVGVFELRNGIETQVGSYVRNFPDLHRTFYHFRKKGKDYALLSPAYTAIRVLELPSCKDLGGEDGKDSNFCPVDFYAPWSDNPDEGDYLTANFGFVAGVYWGGPSFARIEFLDLSEVEDGIIKRDSRFGEIHLPSKCNLEQVVFVDGDWFSPEKPYIYVGVEKCFDVTTGKALP